jgi:hypothetical protein
MLISDGRLMTVLGVLCALVVCTAELCFIPSITAPMPSATATRAIAAAAIFMPELEFWTTAAGIGA